MINSRNWKCVRLEEKLPAGRATFPTKITKMEIRSSNLHSCMHLSIKSRTFLLLSSPQATGAAERKKLTNAKLNSIVSWNANWIKFRIWFNQLIFIPQSHPVLFIFALRIALERLRSIFTSKAAEDFPRKTRSEGWSKSRFDSIWLACTPWYTKSTDATWHQEAKTWFPN